MENITDLNLGRIMLMCGALHDLAELTVGTRNLNVADVSKELRKIQENIEDSVLKLQKEWETQNQNA